MRRSHVIIGSYLSMEKAERNRDGMARKFGGQSFFEFSFAAVPSDTDGFYVLILQFNIEQAEPEIIPALADEARRGLQDLMIEELCK